MSSAQRFPAAAPPLSNLPTGGAMRAAPVAHGRFLDACRRRPTDVRPVWFMRQAGRYLRQYREIRARHSILEICKDPQLAAQVTLQPIEILDVDAAIIFADLLLPVEPMGLKLEFISGEGPHIDNAITEPEDIDTLSTNYTDDLGYVGEAIRAVTRVLDGKVPVIGFVGAPFTLASYMIEGGPSKTFLKTKTLMFANETMWRRLMGKLVDVLGDFARLQVSAGARAIQVFDSWVGALSPDDYVHYVQPYSRALIERIRAAGVPVIHFGTGAGGFFKELHAAGGDVLGVDWRVNIDQAWLEIGYRSAIQGNLDPVALFAPLPELRAKVMVLLRRTGTRPGHILNVGHGILPETPVENVKAVVQMVREAAR
jgi:uroporphyrinogen decarboxylase